MRRGPIRVICEGIAMGQTLWDRRGEWRRHHAWSGQRPVNVCVAVDAARLLQLYKERVTAA